MNVSVLASMDPRLYQDQVNAAFKASARAPHPGEIRRFPTKTRINVFTSSASPPALMVKYSVLPKVSASLRIGS